MSRTRIRRTRRKRNSALWLLAGAGLAVSALLVWSILPPTRTATTAATGSATAESRPYVLKWNGPITPTAAGIIVAQADGLFAREGLTITLQAGRDDAEVAATVAADDHVIGQVTAYGFLKARTAGLPIVAFASSYATSSVELYALATTSLNVPADVAGKIISYKPDSDTGSVVEALIRTQQIPRSQIRMTETPASVEQLLAGRIDILPGRSEVEGEDLRALKDSLPDPESRSLRCSYRRLGVHRLRAGPGAPLRRSGALSPGDDRGLGRGLRQPRPNRSSHHQGS